MEGWDIHPILIGGTFRSFLSALERCWCENGRKIGLDIIVSFRFVLLLFGKKARKPSSGNSN